MHLRSHGRTASLPHKACLVAPTSQVVMYHGSPEARERIYNEQVRACARRSSLAVAAFLKCAQR